MAAAIVPSEFIIVDIGGAHDWTNPNRTDLSQMGYVGNGDSTSVVFSIDDTDPSGGESVQGCSLYDSNGNGDVDYALYHLEWRRLGNRTDAVLMYGRV